MTMKAKRKWMFPGGQVVEANSKSEARGIMKARLKVMGYPPPVRLPKGMNILEER